MMAGSKSSNQRPDTLMQDRIYWIVEIFLQRTAGPYKWVKIGKSTQADAIPLCFQQAHRLIGMRKTGVG